MSGWKAVDLRLPIKSIDGNTSKTNGMLSYIVTRSCTRQCFQFLNEFTFDLWRSDSLAVIDTDFLNSNSSV